MIMSKRSFKAPRRSTSAQNLCPGFQAGSGNPAAAKGKSIFTNENLDAANRSDPLETTKNIAYVNQLATHLDVTPGSRDDHVTVASHLSSALNPGMGFQTGSGKPVKVSAEALARTKAMFANENLDANANRSDPLETTKNIAYVNQLATHRDVTPGSRDDHVTVASHLSSAMNPGMGFQTGSGKPVKVSTEALAKTKAMFANENLDADFISTISGISKFPEYDEDKRERIDEDDERELSPILDPRQIEFFASRSSKVCKNLSSSFAVAAASTPTPSNRIAGSPKAVDTNPKVPRIFSKIRHLVKTGSPGPSPKRTKIDAPDLSTQEVSDLVNDLLADEEKCELLGDDSFFMSTSSMIPYLVSTSVIQSRENGRLAQLNAVKHKLNTTKPTEGFLRQLRNMQKGNRIKIGTHEELTRPKQYTEEELVSYNMKKSVIDINSQNALSFRFDGVEFFGQEVTLNNADGIAVGDGFVLFFGFDCALGVKEIAAGFMSNPAVDPSLISLEWVSNHYRWIVWTLAAYEMKFPRAFGGNALTPENLLLRLKYRYDREIDKSERSAIRRIVEHDDSAGKRMILFVSNIYENGADANVKIAEDNDGQSGDDSSKATQNLELSDGWYSIDCVCDSAFLSFIEKGLVAIGTKLILHGAELISSEPMHPLEAKGKALLKFGSNSVRRAKWNSRLGFCDTPFAFPVPVGSVIGNGGLIPLLHLTIARVYPIIYHCRVNGKSEFYSQKYFDKLQRENESKKEREMEKLYAEVKKEVESNRRKPSVGCTIPTRRDELENMSAEQILDLMDATDDTSSIQLMLSKSKLEQVRSAQEKRQQDTHTSIQNKVQERLDNYHQPNAVPFVKIRVLDASTPKDNVRDAKYSAILSIWRPSEDLLSCLSEGLSFKIYSLLPSNSDANSPKRITATRSSKFLPLPLGDKEFLDLLERKCYSISSIIEDDFNPIFNEFDTVGLIVYISPPLPNGQTVYVADENENILGIRLWSPITNQGLEDILALHNFISASNLGWRSSSCKFVIRTAFWQESTAFAHHPKQTVTKNNLEELKTKVGKDVKKYAETCEMKVYRLLSSRTSISQAPAPSPTPPTPSSGRGATSQKGEMLKNFGNPPNLPPTPLLTSSTTLKSLSNKFQVPRRMNHETGK